MSPRQRQYEIAEILDAARDAVRKDPSVTCAALRRELGVVTTQEVQQALRAARWEAGEIPGTAEEALRPQFAQLVAREAKKLAEEEIDLAAHSPALRERMDAAMRTALDSSLELIEEVRRVAVAQVTGARAEASAQVELAHQRERDLLVAIDSAARELAEAEANTSRTREELGRSIHELQRDIQEQVAARQRVESAMESTRRDLDEARSDARSARSTLLEERQHARDEAERHRGELDAVRSEAGAQAARVSAMEAELHDLRSRLDRAVDAAGAAMEAASVARERAAAAEAREAALRDGSQREHRRAS